MRADVGQRAFRPMILCHMCSQLKTFSESMIAFFALWTRMSATHLLVERRLKGHFVDFLPLMHDFDVLLEILIGPVAFIATVMRADDGSFRVRSVSAQVRSEMSISSIAGAAFRADEGALAGENLSP